MKRTGSQRREQGGRVVLAFTLCAAATGLLTLPALGQNAPAPALRQDELRNVESDLRVTEERRRKLEAELEGIRTDRARLNAALLETGAKVRQTETRMAEIETRLDVAAGSEEAIRRSLESRREVIGEVLAALQRMGRRPPPAVLAAPEDVLRAIRTSMLLGAVLPDMRAETQALASDLTDLVSLRRAIAGEKDQMRRETATLSQERERLAALVDARQGALSEAEQQLAAQRQRSSELSRQASDLKELITRSEAEIVAAARAAEDARKADEAVSYTHLTLPTNREV